MPKDGANIDTINTVPIKYFERENTQRRVLFVENRMFPVRPKETFIGCGPVREYNRGMDDKYNVRKPGKPANRQEEIQRQIEELVKRRDKITNPAEKQKIQAEIVTLFAQYERLKL